MSKSLVNWLWILAVGTSAAWAADDVVTKADFEALRKEVAGLRKENSALKEKFEPLKGSVEKALDSKYGPGATTNTKNGKLNISGLVQVWYYSIQNDNKALFQDANVNNITDTNEASDNDSFRVRRSELKFTFDLSEHFTGVIMIDPARENTSFPSFPTNQGSIKRSSNTATGSVVSGVQTGVGAVPRLLQDVYVSYKGIVPHHDFQIGQFKPIFGDEAMRSSTTLDFIERSFIGQIGDARDLGASVHGTWVDDKIQYWLGAYNGAGNLLQSGGQTQNRSDDNDEKDFIARVTWRPVWKNYTWGSLEIGAAGGFGTHGESAGANVIDNPVAGLNRQQTPSTRYTAFASYLPGGPVEGLWLRGEWAQFHDRHAPSSVIDLLENDIDGNGTQDNPKPLTIEGWYASIGYNISNSPFAGCVPKWFKPFEFALRYEELQNVHVADLTRADHTDVFDTKVYTAGINYYLKGHNAKIQLNYNLVDDPDGRDNAGNRNFQQDVKNDSLVVNFQLAF